ncbi:uncharacterized protein LOC125231292 [Leguminivora glycinivorella]|uniref:uncharacterized protein LOC125231292 n=1 Tax=Leguminivora glycinivorella TaxID=1035111 RepID=UPI00200C788E|nr:uncharacterized protein LOC125231292 [Leguminivora glycinivorella]
MLSQLHSSHLGIIKMKSNARARMWWPGIDADIEQWAASCATCGALRPAPPREQPAPWPRPPGPYHRIHIDYMAIGQRVYLVVVDAYSKWLECIYMNNGFKTSVGGMLCIHVPTSYVPIYSYRCITNALAVCLVKPLLFSIKSATATFGRFTYIPTRIYITFATLAIQYCKLSLTQVSILHTCG